MKKLIFFSIIIACPKLVQGQVSQKYSLATTTGYESNIFKSPDSLIINIDNNKVVQYRKDLWDNSVYQDLAASAKVGKKWRKQQLSFKVDPGFRYYYALPEKSYFVVKSGLNYEYNFKKKVSYEANLKCYYINREGTNFDDVELTTPLAYQLSEVNNGLHWRFSKQNRSLFSVDYENKNYGSSSKTHLFYNKIGAEFETQQFFYNNKLQHAIGVKIGYNNRFYKITEYKHNDSITKRDWRYIEATAFYGCPISKIVKLTAAIDYQNRIDKTLSLNGYKMLKPSLALEFRGEKYDIQSKFSYANRLYSNRKGIVENLGDSEAPPLEYKYYIFTSNGAFQIAEKLYFTTNINFETRKTNREKITSRSYRSYEIYDVGVGLKYTF